MPRAATPFPDSRGGPTKHNRYTHPPNELRMFLPLLSCAPPRAMAAADVDHFVATMAPYAASTGSGPRAKGSPGAPADAAIRHASTV